MAAMLAHISDSFEICIPENKVPAVAGLAIAMKRLVEKYGCNAGAIQCWNALQDELGIMPCAANAILNEMGIPIVCETDIHGAITALMVEAADLGRHRGMFADWTVRHPDNENGRAAAALRSLALQLRGRQTQAHLPAGLRSPRRADGRGQARRPHPCPL